MRRTLLALAVVAASAGFAVAQMAPLPQPKTGEAVAIFAGGCFWCVESDFDPVPGVISTTSGYIGGFRANPTYHQVSAGGTGHTEAVWIVYDPKQVTYAKLLDIFWRNIDPTVKDQQFCDHGSQYRSAIFVRNAEERKLAEDLKQKVAVALKKPVYTEIAEAGTFYPAEEYHQDYYKKNPAKYKFYRWNCGRDQRLEQVWGTRKGDNS
jgi:peptide-methionine (S)-S-oxide reductase